MKWENIEPDFQTTPFSEFANKVAPLTTLKIWSRLNQSNSVAVGNRVLTQIHKHLQKQRVEQGGLLIGRVFELDTSKNLLMNITNSVEATDFQGTSASLSMDGTVWQSATDKLAPGEFVIGWYHSHPNLGAFFSGTDRMTQRNFFDFEHSVGLCVDHIRREHAWFNGGDSQPFSDREIFIFLDDETEF